ncbi:protein phosphatase 1 regulatory subunit 14C isoform X1 [Alligator sinensis]|uniref:Protein phosphatase 1 regulatory subunit 14C isoform X1 n=1 Tax=Alligator sinensis TaxID=38654 RepID=A0A3Q0HFA6_ALLSI|nr:protein phosphatase 1 regulatory subunit 14C isoform X1 [Alligator sinensis]
MFIKKQETWLLSHFPPSFSLSLPSTRIQKLQFDNTNREEEMPDVEIDIDDLLDAANEEERALKLQETLVDCYKPTEEFIKELLTRIRGMRKLSPPQKKTI